MQDEIIRAVTGIRNIPPHHAEATVASEAYRSAVRSLLMTGLCQSLDIDLHSICTAQALRQRSNLATGCRAPPYIICACRLEELMPAGVRESLDVSKLERAIEDLEYRDSVLREQDRVRG